ncbi:MAG: T9SS type A sorting domain-containing protein [Bacteroidia bacterium]
MKQLKTFILIAFLTTSIGSIKAQIKRTSVVEHFTNTSCSVCAANNNSIYSSINSQAGTLHISFHPSSPYTSDFFNQQNKTENDNRTHFYSLYGSTPKVAVNGVAISYSNLKSTLTEQASATTNFSFVIVQKKIKADSFAARVVIRKLAADTLSKALLFLGVAEDTIVKTTNNGETNHFNVFRKALTQIGGNSMSLPPGVGDSIVFTFGYKAVNGWNTDRLQVIGILQKTNKAVINSVKSVNQNSKPAGIFSGGTKTFSQFIYPNPFNKTIETTVDLNEFSIYNQLGKLVYTQSAILTSHTVVDLSHLPSGIYYLKAKRNNVQMVQKLVKL